MAAASTSTPEEEDEEKVFGDLTTKEISDMVLSGLGNSQGSPFFDFGGVDRFIKMTRYFERKVSAKSQHVDDEEFIRHYGISSATIGDRVKKFGSGDMRIRQDPFFTAFLSDDTPRDDENYHIVNSARWETRRLDQVQNGTLFEVIRDGERVKVYGSQLVFGDIVVLETDPVKTAAFEDFLKQRDEKREQSRQQTNNNNDDDDDKNQDENNPTYRHEPIADNDDPEHEARQRDQYFKLYRAMETTIPADCVVLEGCVHLNAASLSGGDPFWECTRQSCPLLAARATIDRGKCLALVIAVGQDSNLSFFLPFFPSRQENGLGKCRGKTCCCC